MGHLCQSSENENADGDVDGKGWAQEVSSENEDSLASWAREVIGKKKYYLYYTHVLRL